MKKKIIMTQELASDMTAMMQMANDFLDHMGGDDHNIQCPFPAVMHHNLYRAAMIVRMLAEFIDQAQASPDHLAVLKTDLSTSLMEIDEEFLEMAKDAGWELTHVTKR